MVVMGRGSFQDAPTIVRTIEVRERPFVPFFHRLDTLGALADNWDSYGAARVSSVALRIARAVLTDLSLRPAAFGATTLVPFTIVPVATGGINMEWRRQDAALELWVDTEGRIEALVDQRHVQPRFEEKPLGSIAAAVREVLAFAG